jgi:hypothetical protein
VAAGFRFLVAQEGESQAELLVVSNPAAILKDAALTAVPPLRIKRTWMQRIRQILEGSE